MKSGERPRHPCASTVTARPPLYAWITTTFRPRRSADSGTGCVRRGPGSRSAHPRGLASDLPAAPAQFRTAASFLPSTGRALSCGCPTDCSVAAIPRRFLALLAIRNSLHHREVFQQVDRGHLRIDSKFLRQIAEDLAGLVFLLHQVQAVQLGGARIWLQV